MRRLWFVVIVCATACGSTGEPADVPDASAAAADGGSMVLDAGQLDTSLPKDDGGGPKRRILHGDYAAPLLSAGKVDIPATIARLTEAHITTYAYLIYAHPQDEWDALPPFLVAAAAKGIEVWVYLVPPTESPGGSACTGSYPPFQLDYVRWSKEIATLATSHPNLTAFAMDDFGYNVPGAKCPLFSPAYVHSMVEAAHAIAPKLEFWPVLYWENLTGAGAIADQYRPDITGIIFPFRDGLNRNTYVTASASEQIRSLGAALSCAKDRTAARARSACYAMRFPASTASTAGASASIAQQVSVGAGPQAIDFSWEHDGAGTTAGYVFTQLVVDGAVVWEADIASAPGFTWKQEHVVLDAALAGKSSAAVALRVYHKQGVSNFAHVVTFDEVLGTGITLKDGDFETTGAWTAAKTTTAFALSPIRTTLLLPMIYVGTLSSDPTHPPTAAYVGAVLNVALKETEAAYADGAMLYVVNLKPPDTPTYAQVKSTFGSAP